MPTTTDYIVGQYGVRVEFDDQRPARACVISRGGVLRVGNIQAGEWEAVPIPHVPGYGGNNALVRQIVNYDAQAAQIGQRPDSLYSDRESLTAPRTLARLLLAADAS